MCRPICCKQEKKRKKKRYEECVCLSLIGIYLIWPLESCSINNCSLQGGRVYLFSSEEEDEGGCDPRGGSYQTTIFYSNVRACLFSGVGAAGRVRNSRQVWNPLLPPAGWGRILPFFFSFLRWWFSIHKYVKKILKISQILIGACLKNYKKFLKCIKKFISLW